MRQTTRSGALVRGVGIGISGSLSLLVLLGYAFDVEPAWRNAPGLPAMHPNSAVCILLLAFGLWSGQRLGRNWRIAARLSVVAATGLLILRLTTPVIGTAIVAAITPFEGLLKSQAAAGKPVVMGSTATTALLAIAAAEIFRWYRYRMASQVFALGAISLLTVAVSGYLDGLPRFYGALAPFTLFSILALAAVVLFARPQHGFMRALLAQTGPGQLARLLLGSTTGAVLFLEWLVSRHIDDSGIDKPADLTVLAYQTAGIVILIWVSVIVSTVLTDRIDRRRRRAERSLIRAATTDHLTGLIGRGAMDVLWSAPRPSSSRAAILLIDIDRFRAVSEANGPHERDAILVEIGRRLSTAAAACHLGRIGDDIFAIFGVGVTATEAERLGASVLEVFARPFPMQGRSFFLTASVGVAHSDINGHAELRQAADDAMYVAKRQGGNQIVTFAQSMRDTRKEQVELEQQLHDALQSDHELTLEYQPVVRVIDRSLVAVEALARWMHPRLGEILPDRFIPLAEKTGLIVPLGLKFIDIAVRQTALWQARYPGRCPLININVSPVQLATKDFIANITKILERHEVLASSFCLEVTERTITDAHAVTVLQDARRAGFKVALDDFGVGYSALSQLPRLPLTSLKLDRSFIPAANSDSRNDAVMLAAIVQLAHALKLHVIAEGAERPEQLALLAECGCDAVQGFLIAPPMNAAALDLLLSVEPPIRRG